MPSFVVFTNSILEAAALLNPSLQGMVQYKTVGLIDADAYVTASLDEAFDLFRRSSVPLAACLARK